MHRVLVVLIFCFLSSGGSHNARAAGEPATLPDSRFDALLEGVKSPYTDRLIAIGKRWVAKSDEATRAVASVPSSASASATPVDGLTAKLAGAEVKMECYNTPGSKSYVGVRGEMVVAVPVAKMDAVLANIDEYKELFPDYKDIHIVKKDGNRWLTFWEQIIPVFFLSNLKYEILYLVDHSQVDRPIYRFQLKEPGSLRTFDGLILLEAQGTGTHYTEYDFWDADYGLLEKLAPSKIWTGSVEDALLSDLGLKYRAEHPDWTFKQIRKEAHQVADKYPIDEVVAARQPLTEK